NNRGGSSGPFSLKKVGTASSRQTPPLPPCVCPLVYPACGSLLPSRASMIQARLKHSAATPSSARTQSLSVREHRGFHAVLHLAVMATYSGRSASRSPDHRPPGALP